MVSLQSSRQWLSRADRSGSARNSVLGFASSKFSPEFKRQDCEAAVEVALGIGIINRYFICGVIDKIDETQKIHRLSLEYVKGLLPAVALTSRIQCQFVRNAISTRYDGRFSNIGCHA